MIAQGEVLLHCREANGAGLVAAGDIGLGRTGVEVKINAATECPPGDALRTQQHLLSVGISQENSMRERQIFLGEIGLVVRHQREPPMLGINLVVPGVQIKGMGPVDVPELGQFYNFFQIQQSRLSSRSQILTGQ